MVFHIIYISFICRITSCTCADITSRDILPADRALCPLSPWPQEDRDIWRSWQSVFRGVLRGVLWSRSRPGQTKTIRWQCRSWSWSLWNQKALFMKTTIWLNIANHADDDDVYVAGKDTVDLSQRNWNLNDTQVDNEKIPHTGDTNSLDRCG